MATRLEKNQQKQDEILEEEKRKKIKKGVLLGVKITIFIIVLMTSIFLYTKNIATKDLIVKENRIINSKLPESFRSLKIIHFSDLHYGTTIKQEDLDSIIKKINSRKPDIIVFTGDLIDEKYTLSIKEQEKIIESLKKINGTIGKYAITGEDDKDNFQTIMNQSDFQILNNDFDLIYSKDNNPILLVGLSSLNKQTRNIENAYRYFKEETHNSNIYTILLMHETDGLDNILSSYPTDLVLAGHSHNGQIKIPGFGPFIKREGSSKYDDEYYKNNNTEIFVSSGIGSDEIGFRLFARPSINLFRLSPN